jgi:hypothetical protein
VALEPRPTRVIELIEDGKFDDLLQPMGAAVLRRLKVVEARKKREEKLKQRREKAAEKRQRERAAAVVVNKPDPARKGTGKRK